jgi:hypothetical protein
MAISENDSKSTLRFKEIITTAGWILATLSLFFNFINYKINREQRLAQAQQEPLFSVDLFTFQFGNFPDEILALTKPVKHEFVIRHLSGASVVDFQAKFSSEKSISDITITEGR